MITKTYYMTYCCSSFHVQENMYRLYEESVLLNFVRIFYFSMLKLRKEKHGENW